MAMSTNKAEAMATEDNHRSFPTALFEELLDRSALDAGMTPDELERARIISEIEMKLVSMGRSIKQVYAEWAESTPEQILERYVHLLALPTEQTHDTVPTETGWLDAVFVNLVRNGSYRAAFHVGVARLNSPPLQGQIDVCVDSSMVRRIRSFDKGQPVKIRLNMCLNDGIISGSLLDIEEAMPVLTELTIPPVLDTSSDDLIAQFFVPLLAASIKYDRGVGYFSSGWLRATAKGMTRFAANGGKARWITSPILDVADWEALQAGDAARTDRVLYHSLRDSLASLAETLEQETLSALSWMVADEILDFRLAVPRNKLDGGNFHDKFGIFTDVAGNRVSFNGSYNDSIQGLRNYESIKAFCSWIPAVANYAQLDLDRFERLWQNEDDNIRIFDLPTAAREEILSLRTGDRPYSIPSWLKPETSIAVSVAKPAHPVLPQTLELRGYQDEAIDAWFANDCTGILEMATGTGKTITSLAASVRLYEREKQLAVIFAVPYQHLVDQWHKEAQPFGYKPILAYQSKARWINDLNSQIVEFNGGHRAVCSVVTTHTTFASTDFQRSIARIKGPSLLIADEVHHLGSEQSRQNYPQNVPYRMALSATPDRWFDDEGTEALRAYFGKTVFAFPLERAIGVSLTPYYYYPHLVSLTEEELEDYEKLSLKIARLTGREDEEGLSALKMLLIRRSELLNNAANKLPVLSKLVDGIEKVEHTLFYCAPGQIESVLKMLGWNKGLLVRRFTAEENAKERQKILADFASGDLQALAAMKCLDEGVDVPSTRTAFLLASSSNPREFIQRRGRVLRKAPGKDFAIIYDLIAVPPASWTDTSDKTTFAAERSIIRKELQRFKEFASPARNKHEAIDVIWRMAKRYGLLDF
jgi:superfamily II DNA or RNA helicase